MEYPKLEMLEHTSDYYVKVTGRNLEELFCGAVMAITYFYSDEYKFNERNFKGEISCDVKITESGIEDLLVVFLNEVIFQMEENRSLFLGMDISKINEKEICAKLKGIKRRNGDSGGEIKATTYHNLNIKEENGNITAKILFDI